MIDLLRVRTSLHKFIDPMWESGRRSRDSIYKEMSEVLGREAHISEMSLEEMSEIADYFLHKDRDFWPCHECAHCIGFRHFIPVCKLKQERKTDVCSRFQFKENT